MMLSREARNLRRGLLVRNTSLAPSGTSALHMIGRINGFQKARGARNKNTAARRLYNLGVVAFERGELDGAFSFFLSAVDVDPGFPNAWNNLGVCHMRRKEYKEAVQALDKALRLDPRYELAWGNRGLVLLELGRLSIHEEGSSSRMRVSDEDSYSRILYDAVMTSR